MKDDELQEREWYDDILGKGAGDWDMRPRVFIGEDRAVIERHVEGEVHWSKREELGYIGNMQAKFSDPWDLGDELADHSDDQGYDMGEE